MHQIIFAHIEMPTYIWSTTPYHKNHITSCCSSSAVCNAHTQFDYKNQTLKCSQQEEAWFLHPISVSGQESCNEKHFFTSQGLPNTNQYTPDIHSNQNHPDFSLALIMFRHINTLQAPASTSQRWKRAAKHPDCREHHPPPSSLTHSLLTNKHTYSSHHAPPTGGTKNRDDERRLQRGTSHCPTLRDGEAVAKASQKTEECIHKLEKGNSNPSILGETKIKKIQNHILAGRPYSIHDL